MNELLMAFAVSFLLSLALTPLAAFLCRKFGLVDMPGERRINAVPVPRGGGMGIVVSVSLTSVLMSCFSDSFGINRQMVVLSASIAILGFVDDKVSLRPIVKLTGQIIISFLAWFWGGVGFSSLFPGMSAYVDCFLTVFWFVGAINAFNLIDGLDGLASGVALIGVVGMAGALYFCGVSSDRIVFHAVFSGALLGFLRYNFNPASVFLGDSGSMYIGFMMAALPLLFLSPRSFLVSIGVPLLAMGVPIFDTLLAIMRRSIRMFIISGRSPCDGVMSADVEHLHHRILRKMNFSQRKAAYVLYAMTFLAVSVGYLAMIFKSKAAGLWLGASTVAVVIIVRSIAKVEFFDMVKILDKIAHADKIASSRSLTRFSVLAYICIDSLILIAVFFHLSSFLMFPDAVIPLNRWKYCLLFSSITFIMMVCFNVYRIMWSRAQAVNYAMLFVSCVLGSAVSSSIVLYMYAVEADTIIVFSVAFCLVAFSSLLLLRTVRHLIREVFYYIDSEIIRNKSDTVRTLVYGTDIGSIAFRRELVRNATRNKRIIVGLIDDSIARKGLYIGMTPVFGAFDDIEEIVLRTKADMIVLTSKMPDEKFASIKTACERLGIRVSLFKCEEEEILLK